MNISKRERLIVIATGVVVALLVLDHFVWTSVKNALDDAQLQQTKLQQTINQDQQVLDRQRTMGPKWKEMITGGLKHDPTEAESQVLHSIREWCQDAGLTLVSLQPEREPEKKILQEIAFRAVGTGSMNAVSRFLWRVETSKIPVRIKEMQVGSRKEGADDLTIQLRLSTLYQPPAASPAEAAAPAKSTGGAK
jgi:Tfp pilus assembly protein PilO